MPVYLFRAAGERHSGREWWAADHRREVPAPACSWTASTETPWLAITDVTPPGIEARCSRTIPPATGDWTRPTAGPYMTAADAASMERSRVPSRKALAARPRMGMAPPRLAAGTSSSRRASSWLAAHPRIEAWAQSGGGGIIGGSVWTLSLNGPTVRFRSALSETTYFDFESVRSVNDGAWHHIAATYEPSTLTARLYIDGQFDSSATASAQPHAEAGSSFGIGPAFSTLDEIALYQSALTPEQITRHYLQHASASDGAGVVTLSVVANPSIDSRAGLVTVAGQQVSITQLGRPCFTVTPASLSPRCRQQIPGDPDRGSGRRESAWTASSPAAG